MTTRSRRTHAPGFKAKVDSAAPRHFLTLLLMLWAFCIPLPATASPPTSWAIAAVSDLHAVHDLIAANHPGPVNHADPGFDNWLNDGLAMSLPQAHAAHTEFAYRIVLRDYVNGFGDGHVNIAFSTPQQYWWPGFLTATTNPDGPIRIAVMDNTVHAPLGTVIESCGGISAASLLQTRVIHPRLNRHVPQRLPLYSPWMLVASSGDPALQWQTCATPRGQMALHWRAIDATQLQTEFQAASGIQIPSIGLAQIGDVTIISLPTFAVQGATLDQMQRLISALRRQATTLHKARHVVIDLRGNDGGDDGWGYDVAETLWGARQVDAIANSFDATVVWRVSALNETTLRAKAELSNQQGDTAGAAEFTDIANRMQKALAAHETFLREAGLPSAVPPPITDPFAHPVYILTTPYCASACLDFVDVTTELAGTVRAGLETSSDTDYLEVSSAPLPSGMATLHYAMKVYRNRQRLANMAYTPAIPWPGGEMTDRSIANWIDKLR